MLIVFYVGLTITNDLKWDTHITNFCTKANRTLGFLRRSLFSQVAPPPSFLEKLQNRAARFLTRNYTFEEGSMTGIQDLKNSSGNLSRKGGRIIDFYCCTKV